MTVEKAVQALVDAGLLAASQTETAVAAIKQTDVEFTYLDWANALAEAGLVANDDTARAADIMQNAGWAEAENDPDAFDEGLENASLL